MMKNKYLSCGLNYDLIIEKYPNIDEYEMIVNAYLDDEFFYELKDMLEQEDYGLAKDATKGLYVLASDLCLYPLYERLVDIYEDIELDMYKDMMGHYQDMIEYHDQLRGIFYV